MKKFFFLLVGLFSLSSAQATKIKTSQDSISYALGYIVGGQQLSSYMIKKYNCNKEVFLKAIEDALNSDSTIMGQKKASNVIERADNQVKITEENQKEQVYLKAKISNDAYLKKNLQRSGFEEIPNSWDSTANGIQRKIITEGDGDVPTMSSAVKFNYKYSLTDGTLISKSDDDQPTIGMVGNLLPGLQDALTNMPVGSKWEIVMPSEMGFDKEPQYNEAGKEIVPANSILIFDLELLSTGTPEDLDLDEDN